MTTAITSNSVTNLSNLTGATSSVSDATASQDRFLKLLVAQLNNQDPMHPMDNAQMTSQMAQINTVSGIQQLNETLKSLVSQSNAQQLLQASSLVGHEVLAAGSTLPINNGIAKGAIELPSNATSVTVELVNPNGQVIDKLDLGALNAGRHDFEWTAPNSLTDTTVTARVTAMANGNPLTVTTLARSPVQSVSNTSTGLSLSLRGGSHVAYTDVQGVF